MTWIVWSLLSLITGAVMVEVNRHFQCAAKSVNFLRAIVATVLFGFFMPWMQWPSLPTHWPFYGVSILDATFATWAFMVLLALAAQGQSRITAMQGPIIAFASFILWSFIDPTSLNALLARPIALTGVIVAMGLATLSVLTIRRNDTGWRLLLIITPIALGFAVLNVGIKYVVPADHAVGYALSLAFVAYALNIFTTGVMIGSQVCHWQFTKREYIAALWYGTTAAISFFSLIMALSHAPNPAYPTVIGMTMPALIWIYHRLRGWPDNASPVAGLVLVLAAIILMLSAAV